MEQWTVDYVDVLAKETLDRAFVERRQCVFPRMRQPGFDWDKTIGMVVRGWIYAREHPSWMQEVPYAKTVAQFARLLGFAVEKTTTTGHADIKSGVSSEGLARLHIDRQIEERELVTEFVFWALRSYEIP